MENVIIKSIKEMPCKTPGKVFWAVEMNGGRKATIGQWDSQLADYIIKDVMPSGNYEVELELTIKGDYTNITDIKMKSPTELKAEVIKAGDTIMMAPKQSEELGTNGMMSSMPKMFSKDKSIIAQCMVKGAVELAKNLNAEVINSNESLGEFLCMAVNELVGAYKVALDRLE